MILIWISALLWLAVFWGMLWAATWPPKAVKQTPRSTYRPLRYGDDTITPGRVARYAAACEANGTEEGAYAASVARRALAGDRHAQDIVVGLIAESYFEAYMEEKSND